MPRPRSHNIQIKVPINEHILTQIDDRFRSPITGRPQYGARGTLINALISLWIKSGYSISTLSHALENHRAQQRESATPAENLETLEQLMKELEQDI